MLSNIGTTSCRQTRLTATYLIAILNHPNYPSRPNRRQLVTHPRSQLMLKPTLQWRLFYCVFSYLFLAWLTPISTVQAQVVSQMRLTAADGNGFGTALAASGTTLMVGDSYWTSAYGSTLGAAYLFTQAGGGWTPQAELTASDGQP